MPFCIFVIMVLAVCGLDFTSTQEFNTTLGRVRGTRITVLGKSVDVLHGIPFATPPVGDLRFKYPKPADPWSPTVKDAIQEKPSCIQPFEQYAIFLNDTFRHPPNETSEDCLYLSIWRPVVGGSGSKLPVMFWIYPGGFNIGTTRTPLYNGQYLAAENDVIVVSVNYRLGALGFAYLSPDTIPGNMGLMDQVMALRWVKDNIENFGGDPNKVTLFGLSAGSVSISLHLVSPLSQDLFNNGIMQSGVPVTVGGKSTIPQANKITEFTEELSKSLACPDLTNADIFRCLKNANAKDIKDKSLQITARGINYSPVIDGFFLPEDPMSLIKRGAYRRKNIINGVNKHGTTLFFFSSVNASSMTLSVQMYDTLVSQFTSTGAGSKTQSALKLFYESEQSPPLDRIRLLSEIATDFRLKCPALYFNSLYSTSNNIYMYSADHSLSVSPFPDWLGVPQTYELELIFGLPLNDSYGFTKEEKDLSRNTMAYWTNFAKSGDPNSPAKVTTNWTAFDITTETYLSLNVSSNLANRQGFRRHQCAFMNEIFPMIPEQDEMTTTSRPHVFCTSGRRNHYPGYLSALLCCLPVLCRTINL